MSDRPGLWSLAPMAAAALAFVVVMETVGTRRVPHPEADRMLRAVGRSQLAMTEVAGALRAGGVRDGFPEIPNGILIGEEYSDLTTTLGSLDAKKLSLEPRFAALIVRLVTDAGIRSGDAVGVSLSGSFPALAISVISALRECGSEVVLVSSLGSSTYGANRPDATWADIEAILESRTSLRVRSALMTPGGEEDRGWGMPSEGMDLIRIAAARTGRDLFVPSSLDDAIGSRMRIFQDAGIGLVINIGGNQAMLGACAHAPSLPTGLWKGEHTCAHADRGVMARLSERGISVVHLLNLKDLAENAGLAADPPLVFSSIEHRRWIAYAGLALLGVMIAVGRRRD